MGGCVGRAVGEEVEMSAVEEPASCRHLSAFSLIFGTPKPRQKSDHKLVEDYTFSTRASFLLSRFSQNFLLIFEASVPDPEVLGLPDPG